MLISRHNKNRISQAVHVFHKINENVNVARQTVAPCVHRPQYNPGHPKDNERTRDREECAKHLAILVLPKVEQNEFVVGRRRRWHFVCNLFI